MAPQPELAHPYHVLESVANITVASPKGGEAPLDPSSVKAFENDDIAQKFLKEKEAVWKNTKPISQFLGKTNEFSAIFFVGGHGPMFDLSSSEESIQLVKEFAESDKVVSAVCHGPAGLLNVKLSDGKYLVSNEWKLILCYGLH